MDSCSYKHNNTLLFLFIMEGGSGEQNESISLPGFV